ncbi:transcriptional regulator, TetR family [Clostridium cavendishii DSM 21758]|uniref:Transcriptional regulator, TetR family n=1 Tax=Clostridium cavendishii DSM 21758 TaxID=1121302 RepID=A0A1M6HJK9_9CLOT|nr:TetR/AcrR family transcriptional regulator [Clostridium cavendishii]SHJ22383.1 transcriptional regulator, TetR family [Clostridium cavendishii DSM 21758]
MEEKKNQISEQSKKWMINALLDIMKEKQYQDITIKEITDKATLSRRTFYRNFSTKEELLSQYAKELMEDYIDCLRQATDLTMHNVIQVYFEFWQKHLDFLELLKKNELLFLLFEKYNEFLPKIRDAVNDSKYDEMINSEYIMAFSAGGYCNLLFKWLSDGAKKSPEEMSEIFLQVRKYFN